MIYPPRFLLCPIFLVELLKMPVKGSYRRMECRYSLVRIGADMTVSYKAAVFRGLGAARTVLKHRLYQMRTGEWVVEV